MTAKRDDGDNDNDAVNRHRAVAVDCVEAKEEDDDDDVGAVRSRSGWYKLYVSRAIVQVISVGIANYGAARKFVLNGFGFVTCTST